MILLSIVALIFTWLLIAFGFYVGTRYQLHSVQKDYQDRLDFYILKVEIDRGLNEFERMRIKELRMMAKGYQACYGCKRVAGLPYKDSKGNIYHITLKRKWGKYVCQYCEARVEQQAQERKILQQKLKSAEVKGNA